MSSRRLSARRDRSPTGRSPGLLLAGAAAVVGLAIALEGGLARAVNGVGVVAWFVAAGLLVRSLRGARGRAVTTAAVVALVLVLAFLVRPSDLSAAAVGFFVAGAIVAAVARDRPIGWALLVPAGWLPAHVAVAIGRSILREGVAIRTEPPPTTVLVPLTMVLAAAAGAAVIERWRAGRPAFRSTPGHAD